LQICDAYLRQRGAADFQLLTDLSGGAAHWTFGGGETALATGDHHMGAPCHPPAGWHRQSDARLHSVDKHIAGWASSDGRP
jgi:hypothetical protein